MTMDDIRDTYSSAIAPTALGIAGGMALPRSPILGTALGMATGAGINAMSGGAPGILPLIGAAAGGLYGAKTGWQHVPKLRALISRNPKYLAAIPVAGLGGLALGAGIGGMAGSPFKEQQIGTALGGLGGLALAMKQPGGIGKMHNLAIPALGALVGAGAQKLIGL